MTAKETGCICADGFGLNLSCSVHGTGKQPAQGSGDNYGTKKVRRALEDAMAPQKGMHVGMPKVTVDASHVSHMLSQFDAARAELARLTEQYDLGVKVLHMRDEALGAANALFSARDTTIREMGEALSRARRDAYIRGFICGYDKKSETHEEGPQTYEHIRAWAEGHAISYCDQFDDAALADEKAGGEREA